MACSTTVLMMAGMSCQSDAARIPDGPLSAAAALQRLLDGNARFAAGKMEHPRQTPARRGEIADRQYPFAVILGCSDSRTAPEILFDQGLGDLFVVRVAGNLVDPLVLESLAFPVTILQTRLLIVMGHRRCGAIQAAVESYGESDEDPGPMLRELRPAVAAAKSMPGDPFENAARENVKLVVKELAREGPLAAMIASGELKVVGAVYDLDTGKVALLDD
jgi:carbonic anhydrase